MNILKGFAAIPVLENNTTGQTAIFGELSDISSTYSRIKTYHVDPTLYPAVGYRGFFAKTDVGVPITATSTVIDHILQVIDWVYGQHQASAIPSNANKLAFIDTLSDNTTGQFPAMDNVEINEILNGSPISKRMPDYIQWDFDDSGTINRIKVCFADGRFQTQYDEYEIVPIPPVLVLDDLNTNAATVGAKLAEMTPAVLNPKIELAKNGKPETQIMPFEVIWNDPSVPGVTLSTTWTLVIYGIAGTDTDAIKNAIRTYIADHSGLTVWSTLYPGLYSENEFVLMPLWTNIGVPESGLDVDIYSGSIRTTGLNTIATQNLPASYANAVNLNTYLNSNLTSFSAFFRSMQFLAVGNPNNQGAAFSLKTKFPDYINVDTSGADFLRMGVDTRAFVLKFNDALQKAITLTASSSVPVGYTRQTRDGKHYLTFALGGFSYLVLSKGSYVGT